MRFEYPSAKNYQRFESFLSPSLLDELKQAEKLGTAGPHASAHAPEFKKLTETIIKELSESLDVRKSRKPPTQTDCLKAISIGPFESATENVEILKNWIFCKSFASMENLNDLLKLSLPEMALTDVLIAGQRYEPSPSANSGAALVNDVQSISNAAKMLNPASVGANQS